MLFVFISAYYNEVTCVGYQNISLPTYQGFNYVAPNFIDVAETGTNTLGDIKVNNKYTLKSKLQFLDKGGAMKKFTLPDGTENVSCTFLYQDGEELYIIMDPDEDGQKVYGYTWPSEIHPPSGWYVNYKNTYYCMNDVEIPFGCSMAIYGGDNGAAIVSSGAVSAKDATIKLEQGGFNMVGNCMPVNITLGDVTVNNKYTLKSKLQFFDKGGAMKKFTLPDGTENVSCTFLYLDGEELYILMDPDEDGQKVYGYTWPSEIHPPSGWYVNYKNTYYCMNSVPLNAGDGFAVYGGDTGAVIVIPSPLADMK